MNDRMHDELGPTPPLARALRAAHASFSALDDSADALAFQAAQGRATQLAVRARRARSLAALTLAAALVLLVGLSARRFLFSAPAALALTVQGAELQKEGFVRATKETHPSLRFSDGTRVGLSELSSLRVRSVGVHGAQIAVEQGEIRAEVVHLPQAAWVFDAGPFVVDVKGTTFTLSWDSVEGRLEVRLEKGLLAIHTPFTAGPIALEGGQRLVARVADQRADVSLLWQNRAEDSASLTSASAPSAPPALSAAPPVSSVAPKLGRASPSSWAQQFAAGDFAGIVTDAEDRGLESVLSQRGTDDLALLADAARFSGRSAVAQRALLAQRQRFARSPRAFDAAFMLGRLQEPADPGSAARWYDRYLAEAPHGAYAAEALGRKMLLVQRASGAASARPLAEEYLRRYPRGPHAKAAEIVLGRNPQ